jgi:hypothetical protein
MTNRRTRRADSAVTVDSSASTRARGIAAGPQDASAGFPRGAAASLSRYAVICTHEVCLAFAIHCAGFCTISGALEAAWKQPRLCQYPASTC